MVPATTSLTGFSGETIWPRGQLRLWVTIGDAEHFTKAWMNFMIVRSPSPYNGIIGRPGIREIQAVPSTAHGILKFPVDGEVVTIRSTILTPNECVTITATSKDSMKKIEGGQENVKVAIHYGIRNRPGSLQSFFEFSRFGVSFLPCALHHFFLDGNGIRCFRNWSNNMEQHRMQHWAQDLDYATEFGTQEDSEMGGKPGGRFDLETASEVDNQILAWFEWPQRPGTHSLGYCNVYVWCLWLDVFE
ncbi:hypothetical protein Tco_0563726 [Tanacetum coccineum]